jgi:UrcA family protein
LTEARSRSVQHDSRRFSNYCELKEKIMNTRNQTQQIVMAAVAAICVASATMAAHADELNAPTRTVHYADLNLDTPAGISTLYKRIRYTAEELCGDAKSRGLPGTAVAHACVDHAVYISVHSLNNVKLTDEYNAHAGKGQGLINVASTR